MGRVSPRESNGPRVLAQCAINHIWMQEATCCKALPVVAHRPEEWPLDVLAVFCEFEIVTDALCCLWMNSKTPLLAAFAYDLQRIKSTVHVKVTDFEARDLGPSQTDLQTDCQ